MERPSLVPKALTKGAIPGKAVPIMRRSHGLNIFWGLVGGLLATTSLWAEPTALDRGAGPVSLDRESVTRALAALPRHASSPREIVARKQAFLASLPTPTPVPASGKPVPPPPPARPALPEPQRLRVEFGEAMAEIARAEEASPRELVRRKAALLAANAETLRWADAATRASRPPVPAPPGNPKPLEESLLRGQLAALMVEIRRQPVPPAKIIADIEKFRRDNAEAFEAVKRNPDEPAAQIVK